MKSLLILFTIIICFTGCKDKADKNEPKDFSLLDGNNFIMKADRVCIGPDVQFPRDTLVESYYTKTDEDIQYNVSFSEDSRTINIEPGQVSGEKTNDGEASKYYELNEGLFAGGRFLIWIYNNEFQAEYTVYGSGVPIIRSERGKLILN